MRVACSVSLSITGRDAASFSGRSDARVGELPDQHPVQRLRSAGHEYQPGDRRLGGHDPGGCGAAQAVAEEKILAWSIAG
jgi:hypothetical protein